MPEISQLPIITTLQDDDLIPVYDTSETEPIKLKRITFEDFKNGFSGFSPSRLNVVLQQSDVTLTEQGCNKVYLVNGDHTVTLPDLTDSFYGTWVWIKNVAANGSVVVSGTLSDGETTITQGGSILFVWGDYGGLFDAWYPLTGWSGA
jgi:hypothetical protein